jgi:hypothetical protein
MREADAHVPGIAKELAGGDDHAEPVGKPCGEFLSCDFPQDEIKFFPNRHGFEMNLLAARTNLS